MSEMRAAFAALWEREFQGEVPHQNLRSLLDPPIPVAHVLDFEKLCSLDSEVELQQALDSLIRGLCASIRKEQPTEQPSLFDVRRSPRPKRRAAEVGTTVPALSDLIDAGKTFSTVYADPPWRYDNTSSRAAAEGHYQTMALEEICAEPVRELTADDAHLHLWSTNAHLRDAFSVIDAWGFTFKSCFVWVKSRIGMGNYWRVSHEFLLLGVRGKQTFLDRSIPSWIEAPRTTHSRKPAVIRSLIERVSPGPFLEMYGREELPNSEWTVYGNQIERRLF